MPDGIAGGINPIDEDGGSLHDITVFDPVRVQGPKKNVQAILGRVVNPETFSANIPHYRTSTIMFNTIQG